MRKQTILLIALGLILTVSVSAQSELNLNNQVTVKETPEGTKVSFTTTQEKAVKLLTDKIAAREHSEIFRDQVKIFTITYHDQIYNILNHDEIKILTTTRVKDVRDYIYDLLLE